MSPPRRPGPLRIELDVCAWSVVAESSTQTPTSWTTELRGNVGGSLVPRHSPRDYSYMTSGVMPKWWRPSLPLNVSEAEAGRIAGKLVDAVQHAPEKEEPSGSPSERVKIHHCAEVKDWFLDLVTIQRERLGWDYITTFRHAQLVAPDIFGGMNVSVPKRWKYSDEKSAFRLWICKEGTGCCVHCAARDPESSHQQGHRLNLGSAAFGE